MINQFDRLSCDARLVLTALQANPSASCRAIAKDINVPRQRVARTVQQLVSQGYITPRGFYEPNPDPRDGVALMLLITMKANGPQSTERLHRHLANTCQVDFFTPVSGELDVIAQVHFASFAEMSAWNAQGVLAHPDVAKVRRHVCLAEPAGA